MKFILVSVALLTSVFAANMAKAEKLEKVSVTFGFTDYVNPNGTCTSGRAIGTVDGWAGARVFVACDSESAPADLKTPSMVFLVRDAAETSHWLGAFSLKDYATCLSTALNSMPTTSLKMNWLI